MITTAQLKALFPSAPSAHIASFAAKHAALFAEFAIDGSRFRLEFFLAQIGHESGGLSVTQERMNYTAKRLTEVWPRRFPTLADAQPFAGNAEKLGNFVYGGRNGNGPASSGDGFRFRGAGYMQLTGRANYRDVGAVCGLDLEQQPQHVFDPEHALRVALGFWKLKKANPLCDTGDFKAVTKLVNGGLIGFPDREAWLDKIRRTLVTLPPRSLRVDKGLIIAVQKALRALGFTGVGAADGQIGPRTQTAIDQFRFREGLGSGGIDAALIDALGIDA